VADPLVVTSAKRSLLARQSHLWICKECACLSSSTWHRLERSRLIP